jgi:hypothetical protein
MYIVISAPKKSIGAIRTQQLDPFFQWTKVNITVRMIDSADKTATSAMVKVNTSNDDTEAVIAMIRTSLKEWATDEEAAIVSTSGNFMSSLTDSIYILALKHVRRAINVMLEIIIAM